MVLAMLLDINNGSVMLLDVKNGPLMLLAINKKIVLPKLLDINNGPHNADGYLSCLYAAC